MQRDIEGLVHNLTFNFCRKPFDELFKLTYDAAKNKAIDPEFQLEMDKKQKALKKPLSKPDVEALFVEFVS